MSEITEAFLKTVSDRVNGCSTLGQLRECLSMYSKVLYSTRVRLIFLERVEFLKSHTVDRHMTEAYDQIEEEIADYSEIIKQHIGGVGLSFTLVFKAQEGRVLDEAVTALVCMALEMSGGKRKEAARLLGVTNDEVDELINEVSDRRLFFRSLRKKLRPIDE